MVSENSKFLICAIGIFVCFFYYGIAQEKILRGTYGEGENAEKFTYTFSLVFVQCIVNYLFAKAILHTISKQGEDTTRTAYYATSSLTYLLAMVCTNMSLQFVNYPTQVIAKSAKPIPVMILGVLLGKKVYPLKKYLFVLLIVTGVGLFMFKSNKVNTNKQSDDTGFGAVLLLLSLTMDGLTSAVQERMRLEHQTKSGHMMLNMNIWSSLFSGIVILFTGEMFECVNFLTRHPNAVWQIASYGLASAFGQYFIFLTVAEFGPLPCSIITTTRKFFTVLASIVFFGNTLMPRQWLATAFVFAGLFLDALYGKTKGGKKDVSK